MPLTPSLSLRALPEAISGRAVWWPVTRSPQSFPVAVGLAGVPGMPPQQIALWDAVIAGNVTEAIIAIKAGADVNGLDTRANPNGRRPLNWAAWRNDTAMMRVWFDAGANINSANRTGFTPLDHAGEAGSKEAATLLVTNGANLTLRNLHGQTPEQTAAATHHPEVAEILHQAPTRSK